MTRLPVEVLHAIFPQLSQKDQLECMTVCRQWYDIIYNYSLFRVVNIRSEEQWESLIECIERDPERGNKVEQLNIKLDSSEDFKEGDVIKLFPNVREFTLIMPHMLEVNKIDRRKKKHPWREHIEKIVEHYDTLFLRTLLETGICKNLSHIATGYLRGSEMSSFVKALANAPSLKTLAFNDCTLKYSDLEILHESVPFLSSLTLIENTICRTRLSQDIKPATSLKSFKCSILSFNFSQRDLFDEFDDDFDYSDEEEENYISHLSYFSKKYTHLEELILELDIRGNNNENQAENEERAKDMISAILGSQLKILSLNTVKRQHIITDLIDLQELDKRGCQIKALELGSRVDGSALYGLKDSTQIQSIQSITVKELHIYNNSAFKSLEWLKFYTNLKELTLGFYNLSQRLVINELLNLLRGSQVETLRLSNVQLSFYDTKPAPVYPSLKNLTLSGITFVTGTDVFISQTFPNLRRLELHINLTRKQALTFPNTNLMSLKLKCAQANEISPILVVSTSNNLRRVYNLGFCCPSILESWFDPIITITCHSVYNFEWRELVYASHGAHSSRYRLRYRTY